MTSVAQYIHKQANRQNIYHSTTMFLMTALVSHKTRASLKITKTQISHLDSLQIVINEKSY